MNDLISRQAAIDGKISITRSNGLEIYSDEAVPVAYLQSLPSAQPYTDEEIQAMQDLEQAQFEKAYQIGVEEGLQSAQPELNTQLYTDGFTDGYIQCEKDKAQWVPCSERPPKDDTEVFVYLFDPPSPYIAWFCDGCWFTDEFQIEKEHYPKAWMPLPKQWKGEEK